jgi:hypothetical protein
MDDYDDSYDEESMHERDGDALASVSSTSPQSASGEKVARFPGVAETGQWAKPQWTVRQQLARDMKWRSSDLLDDRFMAHLTATWAPSQLPSMAARAGVELAQLRSRIHDTLRMGPDVWDDILTELEDQIGENNVVGQLPLTKEAAIARLDELRKRDASSDEWQPDDESALMALVGRVGQPWCSIGLVLRRPPTECFRHWRALVRDWL